MIRQLCLAIAVAVPMIAVAGENVPPGASESGGAWCRVYVEANLVAFQKILAEHVGLNHFIVSATPVRSSTNQVDYHLIVCSRKPA